MSWLDPARTQEAESETALREELRSLLGVGPRNYFESEPTPALILLADDLRREARRRNHTTRKEHSWMLMAAAVPFALVLTGLGAWGVTQKHKADGYASAIQLKEAEIQRMATALKKQDGAPAQAPSRALAPSAPQLASRTTPPKAKIKGAELIIPVDRSPEPIANDTQRVKGH